LTFAAHPAANSQSAVDAFNMQVKAMHEREEINRNIATIGARTRRRFGDGEWEEIAPAI
jgi:hypothetical protein